jgi:hypothetical protein
MMRTQRQAAAIAGLTLSLIGLTAAEAQPPQKSPPQCFASRGWSGWKATPDEKTIYIRASGRRIFRVDFSAPCNGVASGFSHLIVRLRGSSWICNPLDLDLGVSQGHGFRTQCIVSQLTALSSEEALALPKNLRP